MAISLNDHENRIKSFEGKLPDIENRIDNLVSSAKSWEIVTLYRSGSSYPFDSKYSGWNYIVLVAHTSSEENRNPAKTRNSNDNYNSHSHSTKWSSSQNNAYGDNWSYSYGRRGNSITGAVSPTITVLFYK